MVSVEKLQVQSIFKDVEKTLIQTSRSTVYQDELQSKVIKTFLEHNGLCSFRNLQRILKIKGVKMYDSALVNIFESIMLLNKYYPEPSSFTFINLIIDCYEFLSET